MAVSPSNVAQGPHQRIEAEGARDRFALQLFDRLWERYRDKMPYVTAYEEVIAHAGATFVNDHIAFRTIAAQQPLSGIASISRIFEALGYRAAGVYHFEDKHLSAVHFQHPHPEFPKIFISELKSWELSDEAQAILERSLANHRPALSLQVLTRLGRGESLDSSVLDTLAGQFEELPWGLPAKEDVLALNRESQYGAWVLVHGYGVNHFTSLINSHGAGDLGDIEKTVAALMEAGVPMKTEIEGAVGSKLRQTATEAVNVEVAISDQGRPGTMPWTYAYFELAERGLVADPETGKVVRFEGFLGPQATNLFEMTRLRK